MSRSNAEEVARIIAITDERGDFLTDVDGYVYFAPNACNGHLSSWMLRALADELDRRNAPYDAQIAQYFTEHPEPPDLQLEGFE